MHGLGRRSIVTYVEETIAEKIHREFSKYPQRVYPKGQMLVFAGEDPNHIYYLVSGRVRKYDISYRGDEVVVNIFKPYAFFPMSWPINHSKNEYFYKTETKVELHIVPPDAALEFIKANPDVMLDLLSRLYRGTDGLMGRMVHLMSGTAKSRLLYELIVECRRFGDKNAKGEYLLPVNEIDLAARSGLSRETISREIRKLKDSGLVSISGQSIIVQDISALEAVLGHEI